MLRSLWTAASGMIGQQFNIDTISNNLSNVNTTGYKKTRADFEDLLYQNLRMAGTPSSSISEYPTGIHVGLGVKTAATFFGGTAAQQLYQWNVSNKEAGACGGGETSMKNTWANVNTSAATVCNQMDFHTDNNEVFIDFKLVVPYDATNTGVLSDIITISGNTAV